MAVSTTGPIPWANRLNKILNQFHQIHGGDRFPVDVETLALQIPAQFQTGEPIVVQGQDIDPEFEGALFNLNAGSQTKGSWAIVYNQSIPSSGRIRFTLAHELGHYLLHRKIQEAFNCSEVDMLHWDSPERQLEAQADLFASYLLMPIDDFREQISGEIVDLNVLGSCASRYGVSLTAAVLKWLECTPQRAVLVVSDGGSIVWSRSSTSALKSKAFIKRPQNNECCMLPMQSLTAQIGVTSNERRGEKIDARVWFSTEPDGMFLREMKITSDQYKQTITLLILPESIPPWERDKSDEEDTDGLESTYDRFVSNGQLPT